MQQNSQYSLQYVPPVIYIGTELSDFFLAQNVTTTPVIVYGNGGNDMLYAMNNGTVLADFTWGNDFVYGTGKIMKNELRKPFWQSSGT